MQEVRLNHLSVLTENNITKLSPPELTIKEYTIKIG